MNDAGGGQVSRSTDPYGACSSTPRRHAIYLGRLAILKPYRGLGLAKALCEAVRAHVRRREERKCDASPRYACGI